MGSQIKKIQKNKTKKDIIAKKFDKNKSHRFNFYYDESQHSRFLNEKTLNDEKNYYDNFVVVIVGWKEKNNEKIEYKYKKFETKYENRMSKGEIKSSTFHGKQFRNGLASLNKDNVQLLKDFLNIIDNNFYLYFSVTSKIEYIILQLLKNQTVGNNYEDSSIRYILTKSVVMYHPKEVIKVMNENNSKLIVKLLKEFYKERLTRDEENPQLKSQEIQAYKYILEKIKNITDEDLYNIDLNWNYQIAFWGFQNYLYEFNIDNFKLYIDKEGEIAEDSNTIKAAKNLRFSELEEINSINSTGIKIADMLVGILAKLLRAIHNDLRYKNETEFTKRKILNENWFKVNENQFNLYKQLYWVFFELHTNLYKGWRGIYSDDINYLKGLLLYFNRYKSFNDFIKENHQNHGEYLNTYVIQIINNDHLLFI